LTPNEQAVAVGRGKAAPLMIIGSNGHKAEIVLGFGNGSNRTDADYFNLSEKDVRIDDLYSGRIMEFARQNH
jgi:hypothetical protein